MELTPTQLDDLCLRSSRGEAVRSVLAEWGCDDFETLERLKQHHARLQEAKKAFNAGVPLEKA